MVLEENGESSSRTPRRQVRTMLMEPLFRLVSGPLIPLDGRMAQAAADAAEAETLAAQETGPQGNAVCVKQVSQKTEAPKKACRLFLYGGFPSGVPFTTTRGTLKEDMPR